MNDVLLLDHEFQRLSSDFRLMRLCEWAGESLANFQRASAGPSDPTPWTSLVLAPKVIVPMGPQALTSVGISGSLEDVRGYVHPGPPGSYIVPTVAPRYIQRGNAKWSAAFINDLQKAVALARLGLPVEFRDFTLDPRPEQALAWARAYVSYLGVHPDTYLAFDIETPGKGDDEAEADTDSDAPDRTWNIERIGFSFRGLSAISFPWAPEYIPAVRLLLGSTGPKVVWNAGFDVPRLRRVGIDIRGTIHDGMVAWHILHSDLPKSLRFVATFTCPWQPAWKHLSGSRPAFYNATDADVELRSMQVIETELKRADLWDVYERDVVRLEPILVHMHRMGMPIDPAVREEKAIELARRLGETKQKMEQAVPLEARRIEHVYANTPTDTTGLLGRSGRRTLPVCSSCSLERPRKDHFKRYVKKHNPCADATRDEREVEVTEYYRLADFTPSRDQLTRYHHYLRRPLPMIYDKKARGQKVSFGERQIKELMGRYPTDPLYAAILEYRTLDKVAGTYIGRPA
jgi:hypothetical protein